MSDNPGTYLVPSVTVFAIAVTLDVLLPSDYGYLANDITWDGTTYALIIGSVMALLPIVGIFWIGRRWGGNRDFRRTFSALSYCLVPGMLGAVALTAAAGIYHLAAPEIAFSDRLFITSGDGFSSLTIWFVAGLFLVGWTFILQVKAIRILNGFGYARSVAILALSILMVYAGSLTHGIITVAISEFVL